MSNFQEKILKYGSFFLVLLAPFVFLGDLLYPHISTKTFFIYGVVEVLFFLWIYRLIADSSYRLSKKILLYFLPVVLFAAWMSVSGFFAINPHLSFWSSFGRGTGLVTLYHSLALSFVIASLVKKYGLPYIISLFKWFVGGAFVLSLSVWLGTEGFKLPITVLEKDAGGGFAGNSTLTAGYLLFALVISGFLLATKNLSIKSKRLTILSIASIIFSPVFVNLHGFLAGKGLFSLLGTARGTLLAVIAGVIASGVSYMFFSEKKLVKNASVVTIVLGLVSSSFLWVQLITPNTYLHNKFAEEARSSRFIFWDIAGEAMKERPVLGYGPENYAMAYQKYFNPQILVEENSFEGWNDRAHNIFYELGATAGYPSIVLYSLFILSLFYAVYRLYINNHVNRMQAALLAGFLIAYIANNLFTFDSNLSLMGIFILSGILYSFGNQNDSNKKSVPASINKFSKIFVVFILAVLFVISHIFLVFMPARQSKAYAEIFGSAINKRPDLYQRLLNGSSMGRDWDTSGMSFEVYKKYASNPAVIKNDSKILPYAIKDISALLLYLEKISETNKSDYRLYITRNFLQNTLTYLNDSPYNEDTTRKTLSVLDHAELLSPTNPNVYWSMAQVKIWGGDFKGVEEAYRKAIEVAPNIASSYNLMLKYAKVIGNQKLFNETMAQAKERIPGFEFK